MNVRQLLSIASIAGLGALSACGDSSTILGPKSSATIAERAVGSDGNGRRVRVLRWNAPLKHDISGSAVIGKAGGTITLREISAGFRVPMGALKEPTTITVTALAGHSVVFTMSPHGTRFAKPATLRMSLKGTNAYNKTSWRALLEAGYIESPIQIGTDDGVNTYEDITPRVDSAVTMISFPISHFSVVILASQIGDPVPCACNNVKHANSEQ
jgi:hypothetical protein